jgi:hypothetical protein
VNTPTNRQRARYVPGFRPCAACEEPRDLNAIYSFVAGVQCICTQCFDLGFRFQVDGSLTRDLQVASFWVEPVERIAA